MSSEQTLQEHIAWLRRQVDYWQRQVAEAPHSSYAADELERHRTLLRKAKVALAADERQGKLFDVR